jgi:hypothetical protein
MMHSLSRLGWLLLLASIGLDAAELPKKAALTKYAGLWTNSPFTTKPPPAPNAPEANPFEDLALKGIAPLANNGYLITLINRKNPAEITTIDTERPAASDYTFIKVDRNPDKALGTTVHLSKGSSVGTVTYDDKLNTPKPPVNKPVAKAPGQPPPAAQPGQPSQPNPGQPMRQARSRVVPPPTPAGQPGVPPGAIPTASGAKQGTHGPSSSHVRPPRR